tara:strand:- start:3846 stop:5393 length:1548 start_codon:yes stop_codon:yes gene_type:complete
MAKRITQLPTRSKRNTTSNDVLLLSNKQSNKSFQIPITEVFPSLNNGALTKNASNTLTALGLDAGSIYVGGGTGDTTTGVNNNTLVFKGIRTTHVGADGAPSTANHNSADNPIALFSESLSGTAEKGNILIAWDPSHYELSNFANSSSGFLTSVNLASNVTGTLPVTSGGTGLTAAATGSVLVATSTNTLAAATPSGNGKVLISNATTGFPAWATLTAGTNVTITESAGGISIASSIGTVSADLDMQNYDIDMGTGWVSGDGTHEGINIDSTGRVFVGSATPSSYFTNDLNVNSSISLGSATGSNQSIAMKPTTTGTTASLSISGSNASSTGNGGGRVTIAAGDGDGNGSGGDLYLDGGRKAGSGTEGGVYVRTAGTSALLVDENQDVNVKTGSLVIDTATEGIVHKGSATVTQATDHTTGVTINATSGVITLAAVALNAATNAEFTVTNSTVQADSVIILTVQDENTTNNAQLTACTHTIAGGSFKISVFNPAATGATSTTASKIHFLVINNSV